ncbi:hypothetical protein HBH98_073500 [Parastagonospora nodorum]|nr:hypothetical protein HBH53_018470 [Parastagonospora nodorum]KAH4074188.1 hypothetical protein HBH50_043680 [Parastagonospora nodorum]KAH4082204.1 hypothetical protein HBH48_191320 [Parastagonospora nodorum]KAH4121467.1 hypothetical protein HBH47_100740 [Parastagonospora nodorum]KAH4199638.1 hypothetical protein HBI95_176020 [Parastagonospora nodorum]
MSDHRAGARLMIEQYTFATHLNLQNARSKYRTFSLMDQSEVDAVTRMADIYSGAIETLIWLGDKPHLNTALFLINHSHDTRAIRDILHPLVQLHSDPYWSRAWVVQEIVRSKKSIIHTMEEHPSLEHVVVAMRSCGFAEHTMHAIMPLNPVSCFDMWQD